MVDDPTINSCEQHLKEVGVLGSGKSISSCDIRFFQRFKGLSHRITKDVFSAFPKRRPSTNAQKKQGGISCLPNNESWLKMSQDMTWGSDIHLWKYLGREWETRGKDVTEGALIRMGGWVWCGTRVQPNSKTTQPLSTSVHVNQSWGTRWFLFLFQQNINQCFPTEERTCEDTGWKWQPATSPEERP